jgi:predicted MFS family arabinose efflux permease
LFVDYLSWQWIFWINLPLGGIAFALTYRQLRRLQTPSKPTSIDWLGAVLIVSSATPILLGITNVERSGRWDSVATLAPLAIGALFVVALILRERIAVQPMLPLRLFRNQIFSVAMAITFLSAAVMIAMIILVPLDHQLAGGASAKEAGLRLIPFTIGTVTGSFIGGQLVSRLGRYRIFPIAGTSAAALTAALISVVGLGHSLPFDVAATLVLGLAFGGQLSPMTVTVQNALDPRDGGVGISCMLFFRLMGGAFGVALLSAILIAALTSGAARIPGHEALGPNAGLALFHLEEHAATIPPELLRALIGTTADAFSTVYAVGSAILVCAAVIALFLKEIPLRGSR